jgi:hypothetical protein
MFPCPHCGKTLEDGATAKMVVGWLFLPLPFVVLMYLINFRSSK